MGAFQKTSANDDAAFYSQVVESHIATPTRASKAILKPIIFAQATLEVSYRAELFVAVLGASNYLYAEALRSQELEHWVSAHAHCFSFLGGVPAIVVPDNLKSAVTKASRYEPDLNATYADMASHYGTAIIPARPYKPRDKAKVEVGVQIVERWIMARLRKERFASLGELNEAIAALVVVANLKP